MAGLVGISGHFRLAIGLSCFGSVCMCVGVCVCLCVLCLCKFIEVGGGCDVGFVSGVLRCS